MPEQRAILLDTLLEATKCFNSVAAYGWQHEQRNSVELHKATYYALRAAHPSLPSQLVVQARVRAGEAITSGLKRRSALDGLSLNQPIVGERVESQHASTGKPPALAGGR